MMAAVKRGYSLSLSLSLLPPPDRSKKRRMLSRVFLPPCRDASLITQVLFFVNYYDWERMGY